MRNAFIDILSDVASRDSNVLLLTGDLGFKVFDDFAKRYPSRFMNMGVAESAMIGMAAGLAMEGKMPFCYSIVPFLTMRPFEHVRNDICFHHANVKLVGVGGGFSYGPNGPTHHALIDVALMRSLPEMSVLTPGDVHEARWAVEAAHAHQGPVYIRLGRSGEGAMHARPLSLKWGQSVNVSSGKDAVILVSGLMLGTALDAVQLLRQKGKEVAVVSFPSVKPLDTQAITDAFEHYPHVITLEEHSIVGGFGSAVAEYAVNAALDTRRLRMIAAADQTLHESGSHAYLRGQAGLSPAQIADKINAFVL